MKSIGVVVSATDAASGVFTRIGLSADRLDKQIENLGKRVAAPEIDLKDAAFTAGMIRAADRLDKLSAKMAEPGVDLKDPRFQAEIIKINAQLDRLDKRRVTSTVTIKQRIDKIAGAGAFAPSAMGTALALSPALIPLSAGIAAGIGAIGVSFGAATIGAGLFGLAAKSVLTTADANLKKLQAANLAVNKATTAATKKSAEANLAALKATFAPGYMALLDQLSKFQGAWRKTSQTIAVPALSSWLGALTAGMPLLVTATKPVADVFKNFADILKADFANPAIMKNLQGMAASFGKFSAGQFNLIGRAIGDMALGVYHLGHDFAASGVNFASAGVWFANMGSGFLTWSKSAKARQDVQGFLRYLHDNGPTVKSILGDLKAVLPGIFAGASAAGKLELQALSTFLGFVAKLPKDWQKPLTEAAGAMLLLSKTGVVKVGLDLIGKTALAPYATGLGIGAALAAGIIFAVNQKRPGHGKQTWWQSFGPPDKGQQQTWLNSWSGLGDRIVQIADDVRHGVARIWDSLWNHTLATTKHGNHDIAAEFDNLRHSIAAEWNRIWSSTTALVRNGISAVTGWFKRLPGMALGALRGFGHSLYAFGHAALTEFLNGLKSIGGTVLGWLRNFIGGIPGAIMKFLHMSPPHAGSVFYDLGANIMHHLGAGIKSAAHQVVNAATAVAHRVSAAGSGVQRWAGLVRKALAMEGLSPGLLGNVLFQMQTESGGNPNAINLNDINAQMGDPSRGLMQTIMSTFQAYHWPGTSNNIYDPLANIAAALNYARHVYGPSLMSGGMGIGSGHGYAAGSWNVPYTGPAVVHAGEMIIPASSAAAIRGGRGGAVLNIENYNAYTGTDEALLAQRLSFAVTAAGLGS